VQGNQGIWSHNTVGSSPPGPNFTAQIYAYDFALDQDEEVLAARSGTVVDYFDWVPDDSHSSNNTPVDNTDKGLIVAGQTAADVWNFVLIRHDLDDSGSTAAGSAPVPPVAGFDLDQNPDPTKPAPVTQTYAVYGHGRKGSVRATFASRGVAGNAIIGQRIRRGQPIMRCGNTGNSAFNHIHMDVRPGPNPPNPLEPVDKTTAVGFRTQLTTGRTLPFVFRDVSSRLEINRFKSGTDGVPSSLNYYTSGTAKV
jgi:hypothetical protein